MTSDALHAYREEWRRKGVLRVIYQDYFRRIAAACGPGRTLEIGSGIAGLRAEIPDLLTTDIQFAPWVDVVCDAQALPFAAGSLGNLVLMDVLHHLPRPLAFFAEAARVLRPGGRVVLLEPAITAVSKPFFRAFHPEPVDMSVDPFTGATLFEATDPYCANQAIPTLMLRDGRDRLAAAVPGLRLVSFEWLGLAAYPLSGGYRPWSLLPEVLAKPMLKLEDLLAPLLGRFAAFRLLAVMERR